jgi:hypothetical protein
MKNILFEQENIQICNKPHFVENKTEIMYYILKPQYISLLPTYIKGISTGGFYTHLNMPTSAVQRLRTENVELYGVIQRFRDFLMQCSLIGGLSNVCMVNTQKYATLQEKYTLSLFLLHVWMMRQAVSPRSSSSCS